MSFEKAIKENIKNIPLINNNTNDNFIQLQNNFLIFTKNYDEIVEYDRKLNFMTKKEYDSHKSRIQNRIKQMPELLNQILNQITSTTEFEYSDISIKNKVFSQIDIINHKLNPKKMELISLLNRIVEKESRITRKMSVENHLDSQKYSQNSFDSRASLESNNQSLKKQSFDSNNLMIKDVQDNLKYIKKRQEELEEIKVISGQIKELSGKLITDVQSQGEAVNVISLYIEETKEVVGKAELEIQIAEKENRKESKRTLCIFLLILFVLASIISIGILLYVGKKQI